MHLDNTFFVPDEMMVKHANLEMNASEEGSDQTGPFSPLPRLNTT